MSCPNHWSTLPYRKSSFRTSAQQTTIWHGAMKRSRPLCDDFYCVCESSFSSDQLLLERVQNQCLAFCEIIFSHQVFLPIWSHQHRHTGCIASYLYYWHWYLSWLYIFLKRNYYIHKSQYHLYLIKLHTGKCADATTRNTGRVKETKYKMRK